jgi:ABC-type branched-subunit amino acid transport system substrate-binding protein
MFQEFQDTEIVLGMQLPQTGGASPGYNKIDDAARAYFDYVNSKGGVNGRNIKLVVKMTNTKLAAQLHRQRIN